MDNFIKKLIIQKSILEEDYKTLYNLEDIMHELKKTDTEKFRKILNTINNQKKIIRKKCNHPIYINTSMVPDAFSCIYCEEELWQPNFLSLDKKITPNNPILFSPKNPYIGYTGRTNYFFNAIRDEYLQILDEIEKDEKYDITIPEIDEMLDERIIQRIKDTKNLSKHLRKK